ncbi:type II toxin-antitoxin system VapB family antitoxin [Streptomyces sp. NPDC097619]|uniref:type II toxin-antitoxin system VapB family antitoxin n=1 Tax=Streptomyces sp. NPDC097619 TaxID=3157228 RepID=UPI003322FCFA
MTREHSGEAARSGEWVEVDTDALEAAMAVLGTETPQATVEAALRELIRHRRAVTPPGPAT